MILSVTLNPSVDRLIYVKQLVPHDTNRILRIEEDVGGKGINVARVLKRLGVPVVATGFLGGRTGRYVQHELSETDRVECRFVWVKGDTRTNLAIQEEDGSPPTALNERGPQISAQELNALLQIVENLSRNAQFVALGGSLPPGVPADIYATLGEIASRHGAKVVLDADGEPLLQGLKASPYLIKPNENETERLLGRAIDTLEDAARAAQELHNNGVPIVIVSIGEKGAAIASAEGCWVAVPPEVRTVSTIGSGDSMIAGVLSVLVHDDTVEEAIRWGTAAGAATAMTDGSDIGTAEQIHELLPQVEVKRW
ncbi:MAG: tagatose-6-phosphate kinase [Armatimonadota bacterium]|nr:MAG: tagatose-6-phosphate kinase [Armatimonadota bacterium]